MIELHPLHVMVMTTVNRKEEREGQVDLHSVVTATILTAAAIEVMLTAGLASTDGCADSAGSRRLGPHAPHALV